MHKIVRLSPSSQDKMLLLRRYLSKPVIAPESDYARQALVALRTSDPIEDVTALILSLARQADKVEPNPDQLSGLALFISQLLRRVIDLPIEIPSTYDRIVYVFDASARQLEGWLEIILAFITGISPFPLFANAWSRFNLDGECHRQAPILLITFDLSLLDAQGLVGRGTLISCPPLHAACFAETYLMSLMKMPSCVPFRAADGWFGADSSPISGKRWGTTMNSV